MPKRRDNDEERLARLEAQMEQLREEHEKVQKTVREAKATVEKSREQSHRLKTA